MSFSPLRQTVNEAKAWQKVAEQIKRTENSSLNANLKEILQTVKHNESTIAFRQLAQKFNHNSNGKNWLIGRALLFAAIAYISAAKIALTNGKKEDAKQFCLYAAENFAKASQHLPSWERKSVIRWSSQLKQIAVKLEAEPFYALTHLKALAIKAKSHAKFVPPVRQGR
ncbi:MAG: hypothetical protein RMK94_16640 [Armatimonadota bacterium]|nr:hypothetical protein [Armatimonadota bacterium]